jgi:nitrogen fixation NifU-like protein
MSEIYTDRILDHAKNPHYRGVLDPADAQAEAEYPLCGDHLHLTMRFDESGRISALAWDGDGCVVSLAAASMLGDAVLGRTPADVRRFGRQTIFDMLGVPLMPNRVRCALLSLQTIMVALYGAAEWHRYEDRDESWR